jgi:hypothetical protein
VPVCLLLVRLEGLGRCLLLPSVLRVALLLNGLNGLDGLDGRWMLPSVARVALLVDGRDGLNERLTLQSIVRESLLLDGLGDRSRCSLLSSILPVSLVLNTRGEVCYGRLELVRCILCLLSGLEPFTSSGPFPNLLSLLWCRLVQIDRVVALCSI